jgi:hypothetical protein
MWLWMKWMWKQMLLWKLKEVRELTFILSGLIVLLVSCQSDSFKSQALTDNFTQDFNPQYVDVLWVTDDRSPMRDIADRLTAEATALFSRIDGASHDYRMAITTMDRVYNQGQLKPKSSPTILVKNVGTLEQRNQLFRATFSIDLNLRTDFAARAFETAELTLQKNFIPRAGAPLVLIFLSDGDDTSVVPAGKTAIDHYKSVFLGLKENRSELVRIYSINYRALEPGEAMSKENRCATYGNADIDKTNGSFQDRFFKLAEALGGVKSDICQPFSQKIDLSGLKLKELTRRFPLKNRPDPSSLEVSVFFAGGAVVEGLKWSYDAATNELVFETAPPEGTTIQATYLAGA